MSVRTLAQIVEIHNKERQKPAHSSGHQIITAFFGTVFTGRIWSYYILLNIMLYG